MASEHKIRQYTATAGELIEVMELDGYMDKEELKEYLFLLHDECTEITKEEFYRRSTIGLFKHELYKEFLAGEVKFCHGCKITKPKSSFFKHNSTADRLDTMCKMCRREWRRERYDTAKYRERKAKSSREYRNRNLEVVKKRCAEWKKNNPTQHNIHCAKSRMNNKLKENGFPLLSIDQVEALYSYRQEFDYENYYVALFKHYKAIDYPLTKEIQETLSKHNWRKNTDANKVHELMSQGLTIKATAEAMGVSDSNVKYILKRYGGKKNFLDSYIKTK